MFEFRNCGRPFSADDIRDRAEWTFETRHFLVAFEPEPEDLDPADCFERADDIEIASSGEPHDWFCAVVSVYAKRDDDTLVWLSNDVLGGCSYQSFHDFIASHRDRDPMNRNCSIMRAARGEMTSICHYFPGMVLAAVSGARKVVGRDASIRLRAA